MQTRQVVLTFGVLLAATMAGCGGGQSLAPAPGPPGDGGGLAGTVQVGPMLVRPASAAGFVAEEIPSPGDCAFVAIHGAAIEYLESQALLDRIVFNSFQDGTWDIWVCDLDGSNLMQITNNTATEQTPEWSPDGSRVAFVRQWQGQDNEIMVVNADGSGVKALTSNTDRDMVPTWSPVGRTIAFDSDREGNNEIFSMYDDGSMPTNLTNHPGDDRYPAWSPDEANPEIAFTSDRDTNYEIYKMDVDGSGQTRLTDSARRDFFADWSPDASMIVWDSRLPGPTDPEVYIMTATGADPRAFSQTQYSDQGPSWSTDGRWIGFASNRSTAGESRDIWVQMTEPPFTAFRVTTVGAVFSDLGSPTVQTERVLIGPAGSDWGGFDPIWTGAYAGIVVFDDHGYVNFVRIGVSSSDAGSLDITPLDGSGERLAGVLLEADEIVNLREDAGRGQRPTKWDFGSLDPGAVAVYLDNTTGKVVSALVVRDTAYPSAAGSVGGIEQRAQGGNVVVEGDFSAVFDGEGNRVAADVSAVTISAEGGVVSAE